VDSDRETFVVWTDCGIDVPANAAEVRDNQSGCAPEITCPNCLRFLGILNQGIKARSLPTKEESVKHIIRFGVGLLIFALPVSILLGAIWFGGKWIALGLGILCLAAITYLIGTIKMLGKIWRGIKF
jgi:hypothetical protein